MRKRGHMAGGALAGLACGLVETHVPGVTHVVAEAAPIGMTVLGAGLGPAPDVDVKWNTIRVGGRLVWLHHKSPWLKHRGPTHSVWAACLVALTLALAVAYVYPPLALAVGATAALAWGSHILLDLLTPMPVYVFFPKKIGNKHGWAEHTFKEQAAELVLVLVALCVIAGAINPGGLIP